MPPHPMPTKYNDMYSCMEAGYEESLKKLQEIGKSEVNQHEIYLRFICKETIEPKLDT